MPKLSWSMSTLIVSRNLKSLLPYVLGVVTKVEKASGDAIAQMPSWGNVYLFLFFSWQRGSMIYCVGFKLQFIIFSSLLVHWQKGFCLTFDPLCYPSITRVLNWNFYVPDNDAPDRKHRQERSILVWERGPFLIFSWTMNPWSVFLNQRILVHFKLAHTAVFRIIQIPEIIILTESMARHQKKIVWSWHAKFPFLVLRTIPPVVHIQKKFCWKRSHFHFKEENSKRLNAKIVLVQLLRTDWEELTCWLLINPEKTLFLEALYLPEDLGL